MLNRWADRHPNVAAAGLFAALAVLFLSGILLPPAGQILGGHDMVGMYYPYYEAVRSAVRGGSLAVWEPNLFGGFPIMAQPQTNAFYPPNWLNLIIPTYIGVSWQLLFHIWLAGMGMYLLVLRLGGHRLPAVLAGIGFAYSGLLAGRLWAGHSVVLAVDAWVPWIILGLLWCVRRGSWAAAALAGVPFALSILGGHIPSLLYVGLIWAAFVGYLLWSGKARRALVLRQAAIMVIVGLGLAAVQLAPFVQFSLSSQRVAQADYQFATDYSLPPAHLVTLLVPTFFGEPLRVGYWSVPTFEELAYYGGIVAILGVVLSLRRPTRLGVFLLLLMVIGLWLALGRYGVLYELAYRFLLPFRLVRAPARAAFLFLFGASVLLGHTLSVWRAMPAEQRLPRLSRFWPAVVSGFVLVGAAALAATGAVFMATHPTDTSGRLWQQIGGYSIAVSVALIGGGLVWLYLTPERRQTVPGRAGARQGLVAVALIVLVVADMWLFAFPFVRLTSSAPDPIWADAKAVIGDTPDGRVLPWGLPIFSQNGAMQADLPSIFGYDPLEPAAHIALAASVPDPRSSAYDVLGAAYVLAGGPLDDYAADDRGLVLLGNQGSAWVYRRARPMAISRLVYSTEVIPDSASAISRIHAPDFDPATTAILDQPPGCNIGPTPESMGVAEVIAHEPTRWRIRTASDAPALHVLAENAYPGWEVTIDGQPAAALTAYTSMRAVCVPAGEHLIEWHFRPLILWVGAGLSAVFVMLVAAAAFLLRRHPGSTKPAPRTNGS